MNVGADVKNGLWAMLGARHGCYKANLTDWNYIEVRDFESLKAIYDAEVEPVILSETDLLSKMDFYGRELSGKLNLECANLDSAASNFFKKVQNNQYSRVDFLDKE